MKTSWKIGRIAGIGIYLHISFPFLLLWIGLVELQHGGSWADFGRDVIFTAALFAIVVAHELGHALTARRFGLRTHDITLLPIGGVAHLERMPDEPRQELAIALAGPAVNAVLAGALFGVIFLITGQPAWSFGNMFSGGFLERLLWANVAMAVFNLMPAFPMDGGRVLRALLALRLDYLLATTIAARIGQTLALAVGLVGLFVNPFLVLIALFVWMGAEQEARILRLRSSLAEVPVGEISISNFDTLAAAMPIEEAVRRVLGSFQPVFPVMEGDTLRGFVGRRDVLVGPAQRERPLRVGQILRPVAGTAQAGEKVGEVFARLQESGLPVLPVLAEGRLVGLLTLDNVVAYLDAREAARRAAQGARPGPARPALAPDDTKRAVA